MPAIMAEAERDLRPLVYAYCEQQRIWLLLLDQLSSHKALGKRDRAKLADLICHVALDRLGAEDDAEVKAIYNRQSGGDFDMECAEDREFFRDMLEDVTGMRLDSDVDMQSPEALLEALTSQQEAHAGAEKQAAHAKSARRPTAAALARERREAAEADKLKQSVRDIFRKLASELHPDREPDSAERERKTALMKRVNVAYASNDLLGLLGLQLEVEQIDQAHLNNLSEDRIKQYNKILESQFYEVEREIALHEYAASMEMGKEMRGRLTPQAWLRCLRDDIADMRAQLASITAEIEDFKDVNKLKAWLKAYQPVGVPVFADTFWY